MIGIGRIRPSSDGIVLPGSTGNAVPLVIRSQVLQHSDQAPSSPAESTSANVRPMVISPEKLGVALARIQAMRNLVRPQIIAQQQAVARQTDKVTLGHPLTPPHSPLSDRGTNRAMVRKAPTYKRKSRAAQFGDRLQSNSQHSNYQHQHSNNQHSNNQDSSSQDSNTQPGASTGYGFQIPRHHSLDLGYPIDFEYPDLSSWTNDFTSTGLTSSAGHGGLSPRTKVSQGAAGDSTAIMSSHEAAAAHSIISGNNINVDHGHSDGTKDAGFNVVNDGGNATNTKYHAPSLTSSDSDSRADSVIDTRLDTTATTNEGHEPRSPSLDPKACSKEPPRGPETTIKPLSRTEELVHSSSDSPSSSATDVTNAGSSAVRDNPIEHPDSISDTTQDADDDEDEKLRRQMFEESVINTVDPWYM